VDFSPDQVILWQWGPLRISATVAFTWVVIGLLTGCSWLVTRRLTTTGTPSRGQQLLEVVVTTVQEQIRGVGAPDPARYLPFVGTLFLFIAASNALAILPGFRPPTGSLSTTTALALTVLVAVPVFGIRRQGLGSYLRQYLRPTVVMLPFNVIGELSRTLALAVRLFGNVMSGTLIVAIALGFAPLFFPIVMQGFGLLTGLIQAYIFALLAAVYIASGAQVQEERRRPRRTATTEV
jgi:F-type H+-transporting ATPase subunit a